MKKMLSFFALIVLALSMLSCSRIDEDVEGEVVAYALCGTSSFKQSSYLLLGDAEDRVLKEIKLGPRIPAVINYIDPFIFIPTYINMGGHYDIAEWVYYVNINTWETGSFKVAWQPREVIPYRDNYVVLSALTGSDTCIQIFDHSFSLIEEKTMCGVLRRSPILLGDNLFVPMGGGVCCFRLDAGLTPEYLDFPEKLGSISVAEWNGKLVATDKGSLWTIDPESLAITWMNNFLSRYGPGVSLVVNDRLFVADTHAAQVIYYNLENNEAKYIPLDRLPKHLSCIGNQIIISHTDGKTIMDFEGNILETKSINGKWLSNFVQVTVP